MHSCCLVIYDPEEMCLDDILDKFDFNPTDKCWLEFEDRTEDIKQEFEESGYVDFEKYIKDYGYVKQDGMVGEYFNVNGQFDWYEVGGRWRSFLKLKENLLNEISVPENLMGDSNYCAYKEDLDIDKTFISKPFSLIYDYEWYDQYNTVNFDEFVMEKVNESDDKYLFVIVDMHC